MTDRRRNGFILLLVARAASSRSLAVIVGASKTRLGLDLKGGVELVYQGKPTPQQPKVTPDAIDRALDIMRERVDALGVARARDPALRRRPDRGRPAGRQERPARASKQVGTTAQLFFYDWETNVLGPGRQADPHRPDVDRRPAAGHAGGLPLYDAVQRAAKRPPEAQPRPARPAPQYYLVQPRHKKLHRRARRTPRRTCYSRAAGGTKPAGRARSSRSTRARSIVQAEKADDAPKDPPDALLRPPRQRRR